MLLFALDLKYSLKSGSQNITLVSCLQFYLLDFCFQWKYSILGTDASLPTPYTREK